MNKDYKKFIVKINIFLFALITILGFQFLSGKFVIGSQYQGEYTASLLDKVARLKFINEPKIIFVGNSNLAFGINSGMIENALDMPIVNLGLHGGLGNAFHENIAKLNINSGDIIIVCHSSFSDNDVIDDIALAWITLEYHEELWKIIREKDFYDMLTGWANYWWNTFRLWITFQGNKIPELPSYSRRIFNEYGDVILKPEKNIKTIFEADSIKVPQINDTCINRLNELNHYIRQKGATLLIAGYPIGYGEYTPPAEEYDKFQKKLAEKLDCEVISNYRDYFIPYDYFYDAILHLNEHGAKIRTEQLIKDIQKWKAQMKNYKK